MSTPHTTEIPLRMQPVEHDPFIDDLESQAARRAVAERQAAETTQPSR